MSVEGMINKVVCWYAKRVWWADLSDLRQEAWVAVLEAERTYDPARGPRSSYMRRAVWNRLGNYLGAQASPVSGRKKHGKSTKGMRGVSVLEPVIYPTAPEPTTEEVEYWWAELRELVKVLVRDGYDGHAAARVLLDQEKSAEVAESLNWPVHKVWRASHRARKRIATDVDLLARFLQGPLSREDLLL